MDRCSPSLLPLLAALAVALASPAARAEPILKGRALNEKSLVEALAPAAAAAGDADAPEGAEVRTRSIRVTRDQPSTQSVEQVVKAPARKPPSASVLITFVTDSAALAGRAKSSLDVVAKALQSDRLANLKFAIEGHADPRGTPEHNLRLSQARAESVVSYLTSEHHIDRERLKPVGKGDSELFKPQQPDAPENRRVTIVTLRE
jgi:outer membrane protein OmpA-like peptidoglycan-associated protein